MACMALGSKGTFGLKPVVGRLYVGAHRDGGVWSTLIIQQDSHCWWAVCSSSTPSRLGCLSTLYRTGPSLPLHDAGNPLSSCPAAFSEPSEKLPDPTHITLGAWRLNLMSSLPRPCDDLRAATPHWSKSSLRCDGLLKS